MATDPEALKGQAQLYVQMAGSKGWARVEDITFAAPGNVRTAHGYGYLAYPEEESRRIAPDHWARGWSDLVKELAKKQLAPPQPRRQPPPAAGRCRRGVLKKWQDTRTPPTPDV